LHPGKISSYGFMASGIPLVFSEKNESVMPKL
jgi:hypothetical protein